ncbi:hypothetical protein HanIR_Chr17g0871621 [Helianthus annuus]|nr:hypothetical protein HanIR_Chr17g0871621 [Helianthus annuus]KAJ0632489.1 hypothetical protein HanLR1_Chr17g0665701 [Helianthus annuus]
MSVGFLCFSFDNEEDAQRLIGKKEVWNRWFSSLSPWVGQSLPYERLAWVNIYGVPPHLVSSKVFDEIGGRYGKVIQPSQFLDSDGDLSVDRLGILIDTGNRINGILSLSWQDKKYKVWVVEDSDHWIPDFLEDDEESLAVSSELGGIAVNQVVTGSGDSATNANNSDEPVESPVVEVEKPKETPISSWGVHGSMQREKEDGASNPKTQEFQSNNFVGQSLLFGSNFDSNFNPVGDLGPVDSLGFKVGKFNNNKPNKARRSFTKGVRPVFGAYVNEPTSEVLRPRKRPRAFMENKDSTDRNSKGNRGDITSTGFEQFCFDLNHVAPAEVPEAL